MQPEPKAGEWGATSLAMPSLLSEGGRLLTSNEDGNLILFNGKHAVAALQSLAPRVAAMSDGEKEACEWLGGALTAIFKDGLAMAVFEFDTPYDRLTHIAVQALAHEEDCGPSVVSEASESCVAGGGWVPGSGRRVGSGGRVGRVARTSFLSSPHNNGWCLRITQGEALSTLCWRRFFSSAGLGWWRGVGAQGLPCHAVDLARAGGGFT